VPPPTEEVPPPTEEVPPPTEEVPPPTEEVPPPTEEVPPPAVHPDESSGSSLVPASDGSIGISVFTVAIPVLTVDANTAVAEQVLTTGNTQRRGPSGDKDDGRKQLRPSSPPFQGGPSPFSASGGVTGGASGGFSFGIFAVLLGALVLASPGLCRVLALAVASPRRTSLVLHVERPG
jgi:hypothetical protein